MKLQASRSQFLIEARLAAGLEVADDDAQLPDVLHELLQVLLQRVELFRHAAASGQAGTDRPARHLPPFPASATDGHFPQRRSGYYFRFRVTRISNQIGRPFYLGSAPQ